MSVTTDVDMRTNGLFVPFRTKKRGGFEGSDPVGTLHLDGTVTGDAGGGSASITFQGIRDMFGFPMLFVPLMVGTQDNLATPESTRVIFAAAGNDRLQGDFFQVVTVVGLGGSNQGTLENVAVVIDFNGVNTLQDALFALWATNEDGKVYHFHVYGACYDAQLLGNASRVPELLAGLR